jgi:TM2 domain-containing membrane protein YozV
METGRGDARQAALVQMMYDARKKWVGIAYLVWLFLGGLGGHRAYVGKTASALAMLGLMVAGWFIAVIGISFALIGIVGVWVVIDAVLIPGWIRDYNDLLAQDLAEGTGSADRPTAP